MMAGRLYISPDADHRLKSYLIDLGYDLVSILSGGMVPPPLSGHPDIFMCKLGAGDGAEIVFAKDDPEPIISGIYPADIPYNAACTGKYFIHNLRYTSPRLYSRARELGMEMVDVRQGYAKCSTVVVDEDTIITYDDGIASASERVGMNVLHVRPGHVKLPGYDTGFIGGASGRVGDTIIFNGDLSGHPDGVDIRKFISSRGLDVADFPEWPLTDIGSII